MIEMKDIINEIVNMDLDKLLKLKDVVDTTINLKKTIEEAETGRTVKLHQGKRQPIVMTDDNGVLIKKFSGFTQCARYLRNELGIKNEQNKLRKALAGEFKIDGYEFLLAKEG